MFNFFYFFVSNPLLFFKKYCEENPLQPKKPSSLESQQKLLSTILVALISGSSFCESTDYPDMIGEINQTTSVHADTLSDLARSFEQGYSEMKLANPSVDPWLPGEGTEIIIPSLYILPHAKKDGIIVNVSEMRMYYFPQGKNSAFVKTFPISIGRIAWSTPEGEMKIIAKALNPTWYPPESIREEHADAGDILPRIVPAGPENPLGSHAIKLSADGYLIHGTNRPYGIGMRVTHGCIRMYPKDVEEVFNTAPIGTRVEIVNQPYKVGVIDKKVYLEVHPILEEDKRNFSDVYRIVTALVLDRTKGMGSLQINLTALWSVVERKDGVPSLIGSLL